MHQIFDEVGSAEEFRDILIGYHEGEELTLKQRQDLEVHYEKRYYQIRDSGEAEKRRAFDERQAFRNLSVDELFEKRLAEANPNDLKTPEDLAKFRGRVEMEHRQRQGEIDIGFDLVDILGEIPFLQAGRVAGAAKAAKAAKAAGKAAGKAAKEAGKAAGNAPKPAKAPLPEKPKPAKVEGKKPVKDMSNEELIQYVCNKAERKVGGVGRLAGIEKHDYAKRLLGKYQKRDQRGLQLEVRYQNGVKLEPGDGVREGYVRLDVYDPSNGKTYDYKFWQNVDKPIPNKQIERILRHVPEGQQGVIKVNPQKQ